MGGGEDEWCVNPGQQGLRGGKMDILNEKNKFDFMGAINFKLSRQIKENSVNNCDFFLSL